MRLTQLQFSKFTEPPIKIISVIGVIALMLLGTTIVISVFWRYALNKPIFGVEDIAVMCLSVVVASAIAYAGHKNAHITIDLLPRSQISAIERTRIVIVALVNIGIAVTLSVALIKAGLCGLRCGSTTSNISIPHSPFYFYLSIALISNAISFVVFAIPRWRNPRKIN